MGSEAHVDAAATAVEKLEYLPGNSISISKLASDHARLVNSTQAAANHTSSCAIEPQTPDVNEVLFPCGPETPTYALFDSFAPGSDKFVLAPQPPSKHRQALCSHVVRRLNFTDLVPDTLGHESKTEETCIEYFLQQIVYSTIVDAIASELLTAKQVEVGTPKCAPRLTGIADTCPPAPFKCIRKSRNIIDKELCRRLDF